MKKLTALILSFVMIVSLMSANVVFANDADFENASAFLSQLGITNDVIGDENGNITRAEFAAMIVRSANMASLTPAQEGFEDVSKSPFRNEIYVAKAIGITNGTSETTFSPDSLVPFQVASKMVVAALGYSAKAEAIGGYPTGYQNVASSLKLYSGITGSDNLTLRDAYILVRNMMTADVAVFGGVENENVITSVQKGKNVLTENFGFGYTSGVVSTANGKGVNYANAGFDTIEIGGVLYKTELDLSYLIGQSVDLWYDSFKTVKLVSAISENKTVTIKADEVSGYDNNVLTVDNGTKEIKYKLKKGFSFIKNGRSIAFDKSDFYYDHGTITLVDNDGDGAYEYVLSKKIEYMVISAISYTDCVIFDNRSAHGSVVINTDSDYSVTATLDGIPATIDDLKTGMACEAILSDDGMVGTVNASSKVVSGTISEMWDNEIRIDDVDYTLSTYIRSKNVTLSAGNAYDFLVTADNVVVDLTKASDAGMQYGYLLGYKNDTGMEAVSKIKLLCSDGTINVYDLKNRVKVDGITLNFNDSSISDKLTNGIYPRYQIVRYRLSDNLITHIDTTDYMLSDWVIGEYENEENSLSMYAQNLKVTYSNQANFAYPNVPFKSVSNVFNVPAEILTQPNAFYDDDMFGVNGVAGMSNNASLTVDVYDYNKYYIPQAVVIYESTREYDFRNPSQQTTIYVVRGVSDYITEDGEVLKRMSVFSGSKYQQFFVEPKTAEIVNEGYRYPGAGDAVRLSFSPRGYINGFAIDVTYDRNAHSIKIHYDGGGYPGSYHGIERSAGAYMTYFGGKVVTATNGYIAITPLQTPPDNSGALGGVVNLSIGSASYMIFDRHTNDVYSASFDDIVTAMDAGEENASLIACKSYYYNSNVVIIYKN